MKVVKLGDIFKITSGGTPNRDRKDYYENGNISWVKTGDLKNKYLYQTSEFINEAGLQNSSAKIFPENTVLIALYGATIGACSILKISAATNQACAAILPTEKVNENYLYYYLNYIKPKFISQAVGGAQPNISGGILKDTPFPLPPLDVQKKIATILDKADNLRRKRREALEKLDKLVQSVFLDMFGDPNYRKEGRDYIKLKDTADIVMGQSPPGDSYNSKGNGIPLLNGPTEFGKHSPTEKQWTITPTKLSSKGDVLFCVRGATAGRMNWSDKTYCLGRGVAAIRKKPTSSVNNEFLYVFLYLNYSYFQNIGVGSTFINISKDVLENLVVPSLSNEEAINFKKFYVLWQKEKDVIDKQSETLDTLFNSLIQRAFKGELKFNDSAFSNLEEALI